MYSYISLSRLLKVAVFPGEFAAGAAYAEEDDEKRVQEVIAHYESQSENEAVAEDEAAFEDTSQTTMEIPNDLVSKVRELIAKRAG